VMDYVRDKGLPAVALCISTTFGPGDWQPTPHGGMIAAVTAGKLPFYMGFSLEVVGIEDAARAMLLAAERGRVGERYIISDKYLSSREIQTIAAEAAGVRPPRIGIPLKLIYVATHINDLLARLLRRDLPFATVGTRMAEVMSPLDHSKAERELGWTPEPVEDAIRKGVRFFQEQQDRR
jgi:dihydroflavonol-4-reductase